MKLLNHVCMNSAQAEVVVPGKNICVVYVTLVAVVVLCELALRQQSSNEVITHLLWCLNDHKMNCSTSLLTTHVSNLFIRVSCDVT